MYNPACFVENRIEVLHDFMREHPLATLVTGDTAGLQATPVPVVLHVDPEAGSVLRCHLARANNHWKSLQSSVLAIFHGVDHYITPSWYPTKQQQGRVVPTWNYVAVHVKGQAKLFEEQEKLIDHLKSLTDAQERAFPQPWSVTDAPAEYIERLAKTIIGVEITIEQIEGKWKMSQNQPQPNQAGVIDGLNALNSPQSLCTATLVKQRNTK